MTILTNFRVDFSVPLLAEFKALKYKLGTTTNKRMLFNGLNTLKSVDLLQLDYTTCPENLEFRKALYPRLRFWMADIIEAGKAGAFTKDQVIKICTFVRAAAVERIAILRNLYPQPVTTKVAPILKTKVEYIEVVQCDESGRSLTEVLEEQLAKAERTITRQSNVISNQANKINKLEQKLHAIQVVSNGSIETITVSL